MATDDRCVKCGSDDWKVDARTGWRRCRPCHSRMNARLHVKQRIEETLPNRIAALQSELDTLRQQYQANPRDARLSEQVGLAERRYRFWADHDKAEAEKEEARRRHTAAVEARRNYRAPSNAEFWTLVPAACPTCGCPTHGYAVRVGDVGWRCGGSQCKTEGQVEWMNS